tara:strand:- start:392 stop:1003 length:612 start_codon:yes stop_codon:yes gene_type:complete
MTVVRYSKEEFNKKYEWVDVITRNLSVAQSYKGLWADMYNKQTRAQKDAESKGYSAGLAEQRAIQTNPKNIERWRVDEEMLKREKDNTEKQKQQEALYAKEQNDLYKLKLEKEKQDEENLRLNTEFRLGLEKALTEKQNEILIQSDELESFYEFDPVKENKEIQETVKVPITENKEIPLETTAPILAVLGIGLVSYYLLKGKK